MFIIFFLFVLCDEYVLLAICSSKHTLLNAFRKLCRFLTAFNDNGNMITLSSASYQIIISFMVNRKSSIFKLQNVSKHNKVPQHNEENLQHGTKNKINILFFKYRFLRKITVSC